MEILDDFFTQKKKRANEKRTFPLVYIKGSNLINIISFLDKKGIDYRIEKVITNNNTTAILPIPSTQLDQLDNLIYVAKEDFSLASQLIKTYIAPTNDLDKKEKKISIETTTNWALLFPILILILIFLVQPYSGIVPPFGEELFNPHFSYGQRGLFSCFGHIH